MKKILLVASVLSLFSLSLSASVPGETEFKKCAGCHGKTGEKAALGKSKIIKDMSDKDIVTALNGYKDGTYGGKMKGLMKGQVMSLNETNINDIGSYIGTKTVEPVSKSVSTEEKTVKPTVKPAMKCGAGKCGGSDKKIIKPAMKTGSEKCGSSDKKPVSKCGSK